MKTITLNDNSADITVNPNEDITIIAPESYTSIQLHGNGNGTRVHIIGQEIIARLGTDLRSLRITGEHAEVRSIVDKEGRFKQRHVFNIGAKCPVYLCKVNARHMVAEFGLEARDCEFRFADISHSADLLQNDIGWLYVKSVTRAQLMNNTIGEFQIDNPAELFYAMTYYCMDEKYTPQFMQIDAAWHHDPERFTTWVKCDGNQCPYSSLPYGRALHFCEDHEIFDREVEPMTDHEKMRFMMERLNGNNRIKCGFACDEMLGEMK